MTNTEPTEEQFKEELDDLALCASSFDDRLTPDRLEQALNIINSYVAKLRREKEEADEEIAQLGKWYQDIGKLLSDECDAHEATKSKLTEVEKKYFELLKSHAGEVFEVMDELEDKKKELDDARTAALRDALHAIKLIRRVRPGGAIYQTAIQDLLGEADCDPGEWAEFVIEEAERRGWAAAREQQRYNPNNPEAAPGLIGLSIDYKNRYATFEDWKKSQEPK